MSQKTYQDVYPSPPLLDSANDARPLAADLLTLEYFEAEPGTMPTEAFRQHHVLLNLKAEPHRVENWRDGQHRDFLFSQHDIVVTPAGMNSGWRWHARSQCIVVTLDPDRLEHFAKAEVGILLADNQLQDHPQFQDADICAAGIMLRDALASQERGSELMFESLARVFLVKLIQKYGLKEDDYNFSRRFTANHYRRVLDFISNHFGQSIVVEDLARETQLSTSHFSHLFKQTIGTSPMQFVTAFRVEQAKKLLALRDEAMIDIAMRCGFSDQAHFSRQFKRHTGLSPSKFRAQLSP